MLTSDSTWLKEENTAMAGWRVGTRTASTTLRTPTYSHERAGESIQKESVWYIHTCRSSLKLTAVLLKSARQLCIKESYN